MARIFITGSSDGLGLLASKVLVEQGHGIVLHARNTQRAEATRSALPTCQAVVIGDVSSIAGIRTVADQVNALGRFDAVIHNVGIGDRESRRVETVDGLSQLFAVNVVAPYLLTALITRPDRLVYLSSSMHNGGDASLEDLQWEKRQWNGSQAYPSDTLARWFRHWVRVRHRSGAERTLRTALVAGATPQWFAATTLIAVTDRYFADGGHALDFLEKAFEGIDLVGWERADTLLPSIVPVLTAALGSEEMDSWRHPVDLVGLAERALRDVSEALEAGRTHRGSWREHAALGRAAVGDDPEAILRALLSALREGASPADVARAVAFAAALRIAHFGTSNDHSDWESAHHTFSYANAAFGLITRATGDGADVETEALCLRAAFHGALAVYLDRYLNVPPARLPLGDASALAPTELRRAFLDACDRQQQVAEAARIAASHLSAGHRPAHFIALLGHALLREDAGFHMVQNLQAAVRQYLAWQADPQAAPILIAAARYLAAHSPTPRARHQTAQVARRLMRGGAVHEDAAEAEF